MMPVPLGASDYPGLDSLQSGSLPPIGYGTVAGVPVPCIACGVTARLTADIAASTVSFDVDDSSRLPAPPFVVQIAGERMNIGAVTGNTLGEVTRGYDETPASSHAGGRTIFELCDEYAYLVSPEPIKNISSVSIDGVVQSSGYTAYTGYGGDEHPSFPGKAVVAFPALKNTSRQRNLSLAKTASVQADILLASHPELKDPNSAYPAKLSGRRGQKLWVTFTGSGAIASQLYSVTLTNAANSDAVIRAIIKDTASGIPIKHEHILVPAGSTITTTLTQEGGAWETGLILLHHSGLEEIEVTAIRKTVMLVTPAEEEQEALLAPPCTLLSYRGAGIERTATLKAIGGKGSAWAAYAGQSYGAILSQTHTATVTNTGASTAHARLVACTPSGGHVSSSECKIASGVSGFLTLIHKEGAWDTMSRVIILSGSLRVDAISKDVAFISSEQDTRAGLSSTAAAVLGDEVTVDAQWAVDMTGDCGGIGELIERPDHVIRHFLIGRMGFSAADMDEDSFTDAGAAYAGYIAGGYRFGFVINEAITPSEFVRSLASQCRSVLRYRRGAWRLSGIPSVAPPAVRTISSSELAGTGAMFSFGKTPLDELGNSLTAYYGRDYQTDFGWAGLITIEDADSKIKYGSFSRDFELGAIRDQATARDVLAHKLLELGATLLVVEFTVYYEHFDLGVGDTIEIENPLFGGRKFFIERIERQDAFRALITARQWWG